MFELDIPATASRAAADHIARLRTPLLFSQAFDAALARVFTDEDRQRLSKFCPGRNLIAVYRELRNVTAARAILDLSEGIGLVDQATYCWLLHEIGETNLPPVEKPQWCKALGKLFWRGEEVRTVRIMQSRSSVEIILDAFESAGWPIEIPNPFAADNDATYQAIYSLNQGLKGIQFHARKGASGLYWLAVGNPKAIPSGSE